MLSLIARKLAIINALFDLFLVGLAWVASYFVRFHLLEGAQPGLERLFALWFLPLATITLYFLLKNQLYRLSRLQSVTDDVMTILKANGMSVVTFVVLVYFFSEDKISRITIGLYAFSSTFLLIFGRLMVRSLVRKLRRRGYLLNKVFVVGDGKQVPKYLDNVRYTPGTGVSIQGIFGSGNAVKFEAPKFPLEALEAEIQKQRPDIVVLGFDEDSNGFVADFIRKFYDSLVQIQILPSENHALLGLNMETVEDIHIMALNQPNFPLPDVLAKRAIDLIGSAVGLILLSPLFLIIASLIKLTSKGPVFFTQERIGLNGKRFRMWKFRTMKHIPESEQKAQWTVENDPRRTKFGAFLRKTSIDELPQLWNVLIGDMSLVGPRPEQPFFVEKFKKEIPAYMLRHKMKAGITGWAQVNGWRGDTSLYKRIEYDLYYIRNWTIWFDIKILVMTFVKGFVNKNAY